MYNRVDVKGESWRIKISGTWKEDSVVAARDNKKEEEEEEGVEECMSLIVRRRREEAGNEWNWCQVSQYMTGNIPRAYAPSWLRSVPQRQVRRQLGPDGMAV
jgi:hypothetical protein